MGRAACRLAANCTPPPCPDGSCCYKDISYSREGLTTLNGDFQYICEDNVTENCCMTKPFSIFNVGEPCGLRVTCPDDIVITTPKVQSTRRAFAFLKYDGTVLFKGHLGYRYQNEAYYKPIVANQVASFVNIVDLFSNDGSFVGLKQDGSIVSIGLKSFGGVLPSNITNVKTVVGSARAFVALKNDGTVVAWGPARYGGEIPSAIADLLVDIVEIESTERYFAARNSSGEIFIWGNGANAYHKFDVNKSGSVTSVDALVITNQLRVGVYRSSCDVNRSGSVTALDSLQVTNYLGEFANKDYESGFTDVKKIYSNRHAFAFLKNDGKVLVWGDENKGGDTGSANSLLSNIIDIKSNDEGFVAVNSNSQIISWGNIENRVPRNPDEYKVVRIESTKNYFIVIYIHRPNDPNRPQTHFEAGIDHVYKTDYLQTAIENTKIDKHLSLYLDKLDPYNSAIQRSPIVPDAHKNGRILSARPDHISDIVRFGHTSIKYTPIEESATETQEQKNRKHNKLTKGLHNLPPADVLSSVTYALNIAYIDSSTNPLNVYKYGSKEFTDYITIGTNEHSYFIDDNFSENSWQEFSSLPLSSQQDVLNDIKSNSIKNSNKIDFWGPRIDPIPNLRKFDNGAESSFYRIMSSFDNFGADPSPEAEKTVNINAINSLEIANPSESKVGLFVASLDGYRYYANYTYALQYFDRHNQPIYGNFGTFLGDNYDSFIQSNLASSTFGFPNQRYKAFGRVSKNKKILLRGASNYASTNKAFCYITPELQYTEGGLYLNQPEVSSFYHQEISNPRHLYRKNFLVTWGNELEGGTRSSNVSYSNVENQEFWFGPYDNPWDWSFTKPLYKQSRYYASKRSHDHEILGDYNCVFSNECAMGAVIATELPNREIDASNIGKTILFSDTNSSNNLLDSSDIKEFNVDQPVRYFYKLCFWGGVNTDGYNVPEYGYSDTGLSHEMIVNEYYDDVSFARIFGIDIRPLDNDLNLVYDRFTPPPSRITSYDGSIDFSSNTSSDSSEPGNYHNMFLNIEDSNYKISYQGCRDDFCDQKEL